MKEQENSRKELKDAPFLASQKGRTTPFKVPDHYFEQLTDQVWQSIGQEEEVQEAPVSKRPDYWALMVQWLEGMFARPTLALAFASFLILIVAGTIWWNLNRTTNPADMQWADISSEAIQQYIASNLDEFDTELLLETGAASADWELMNTTDLPAEEVDQYLEELLEDIEIEEIEELL